MVAFHGEGFPARPNRCPPALLLASEGLLLPHQQMHHGAFFSSCLQLVTELPLSAPPPHLSITSQAEEVSPRKAFAHSVQDPEFNLQNHLHTRRWFTYLLKLVSLVKFIKHSI